MIYVILYVTNCVLRENVGIPTRLLKFAGSRITGTCLASTEV